MPAAQRLGVAGDVLIIGGHIGAHDVGGVASDVYSGTKTVLHAHANDVLGIDGRPCVAIVVAQACDVIDGVQVLRHVGSSGFVGSAQAGQSTSVGHRKISN